MEDGQPIFDPFSDYTPDFSEYTFDVETNQIIDPEGNPYTSNVTNICSQIISQTGELNQPTLKQLLESEFENSKPTPTDPSEIMPAQLFQLEEQFTYFEDASFAAPSLRSLQSCMTKHLTGYLILPAKFVCRIRTRNSNHDVPTPLVWVPAENISDEIRSKFE